jgi:hypothetical protein
VEIQQITINKENETQKRTNITTNIESNSDGPETTMSRADDPYAF